MTFRRWRNGLQAELQEAISLIHVTEPGQAIKGVEAIELENNRDSCWFQN